MKKNVGISDRIIRFVMIDLLLGFSFMGFEIPIGLATAAFVLSLFLFLTVLSGYCPIYHLLGISTIFESSSSAPFYENQEDY